MISKEIIFIIALFVFSSIVLFLMLISFVEINLVMDCSKIEPTEENKLTEKESEQLRHGCDSFQDNSYIMIFIIMPVFGVGIFLVFIMPIVWDDIKQKFRGKKQ